MATQTFKAALNTHAFPFLYEQASRAVLIAQQDVVPRVQNPSYAGSAENIDWNTIQPLFMENVIPIARGLMSVGFSEQLPAASPAVTDFDQLILIRDVVNSNALFSPGKGKNYVYSNSTGVWTSYSPFAFNFTLVTKAYVDGRTLIGYERTKVVEYDPAVPDVVTRVLTLPAGMAISDIRGIAGASNYLLAFTETEILWSTPTNILDLADTNLGAGRQTPVDLKGVITAILPIAGGFLIYTTENIVAASFTDSAAVPFRFREVQNSAGVSSPEQVTGDATAGGHYCYGSAGLQVVTLQKAETVFPDVADFLVSKILESWNPTTKSIDKTILATSFQPKLQYLGSRYLFISYGSTSTHFSHALVYDTALDRWGKVKIDHVDIGLLPLEALGSSNRYFTLEENYAFYDLAYEDLQQEIGTIAGLRQNFGFLGVTGSTALLLAEPATETDKGTLVLGHIQVLRDRLVTFQSAEFDELRDFPAPVITLLGSHTGNRRNQTYTPVLVMTSDDYQKYGGRVTYKNFDIAIEGRFAMTTSIIGTTIHGKR